MGPIEWGLIVTANAVVIIVTYRYVPRLYRRVISDPNAPPNYERHKPKLDEELRTYSADLKSVRDEIAKLQGEVTKHEQAIVAGGLGERARRETLIDIRAKQREIRALQASQSALEKKVEAVQIDLRNIVMYKHSQPREVSPDMARDMASISDRIRARFKDVDQQHDEAKVNAEGVADEISVEDEDEDLEELERDIRERARQAAQPTAEPKGKAEEAARAAREAVARTDAGYEEVEDDDEDGGLQPPQRQAEPA